MKLYVAGPMSGLPELNKPAFIAAKERLEARGYEVASPHVLEDEIGNGRPWEDYMSAAIPMMCAADGLALLPGWQESRGAQIEVELAIDLGKERRDVDDWPAIDPGPDFIQRCQICRRERTLADSYDYHPIQAITGQPFGWYSGDDGEICPECMESTIRGPQ